MTVIDIHTHVFTEAMIASMQKEAPSLRLQLKPIDHDSAVLEIADIVQNPFPRKAWDLEQRFADMDAAGVDMHLVCNVPHTFLYEEDASLAAATSAILNDSISALVRQHPKRLRGLSTLPMQAPELAARELRHAMSELGLIGVHVGSNVEGRNLDDPALEPVWQAAGELRAFILVHPHRIAARDRMKSYYLTNLIGNPLETTIAAASLVFGGVVERHPGIRFVLAHGGGFVPYQAGRFQHGWNVRPEPKVRLKGDPQASLARLCYDTILHSDETLAFLVGSAGASRVYLGSDYPFDMGYYDGVGQVGRLPIPQPERDLILGGNVAPLFQSEQAGAL
jgi:aminocarboxymuconate-semialdehyde decarboxylase